MGFDPRRHGANALTAGLMLHFLVAVAAPWARAASLACVDNELFSPRFDDGADPGAPITDPVFSAITEGKYAGQFAQTHQYEGVELGARAWARVRELIQRAAQGMAVRGWSLAFLQERLDVAIKFARRSDYLVVERMLSIAETRLVPADDHSLAGTIGITVARTAPGQAPERMPMEDTHGWIAQPSPINIELRTYWMDRDLNSVAYAHVMQWLAERVHHHLRDHPELWKKEILYTYGDATSVELYTRMGFRVDESFAEVSHHGSKWKVLRISPERLFAVNQARIRENYLARFPTDRVVITLPDGSRAAARGRSPTGSGRGGVFYLRAGKLGGAHLLEATPVGTGLVAAKDSWVAWHLNGEVASLTVARDTRLTNAMWARAGTRVRLSERGEVTEVQQLARRYADPRTGAVAAIGSRVELAPANRVRTIWALDRPFALSASVSAMRGGAVSWHDDGQAAFANVDRSYQLRPGLWTRPGSVVEWRADGALAGVQALRLAYRDPRTGLHVDTDARLRFDGDRVVEADHLIDSYRVVPGVVLIPGGRFAIRYDDGPGNPSGQATLFALGIWQRYSTVPEALTDLDGSRAWLIPLARDRRTRAGYRTAY